MAEVENARTQGPHSLMSTMLVEFEEPTPDPYKNAIVYLEKHSILQIFQTMTARILYQKPDNPLDFMIAEIGKMKNERAAKTKQ